MNLSSRLTYCAILAAIVFAVYANTLLNGFVYDDNTQIVKNHWITSSSHIPDIFTTHSFGFMMPKEAGRSYRPLVFLVYMAEYRFFGLNPWGWHLVNIVFHTANTLMVFFTASLLLKKSLILDERSILPASFTAALVFGLHPVQSETVAWVGCIPELVFTLLCLAAFNFHLRARSSARASYALTWGSAILFFAALFAKETAVMLPALIFIYDIALPDGERLISLKRIKRYLPYALFFALYIVIRMAAIGRMAPGENMYPFLSAYQYLLNAVSLFVKYLCVLVLPVNDYPFQVLDPVYSLTEPRAFISVLLAAAFFVLVFFFRQHANRLYLIAAAFIVLPILPALYIPGISRAPFADRYLYLPSLGFGIGFVLLFWSVLARIACGRRRLIVTTAALVVVALSYSMATGYRNLRWRDNITLWSASLEGSSRNYFAMYQLGAAYLIRGMYDEGISKTRDAIAVTSANKYPDPATIGDSLLNLAYAYREKGMLSESAAQYQRLLVIMPEDPLLNYNVASVYMQSGRFDEAIAHFSKALDGFASPDDRRDALLNLGNSYTKKGDFKMARQSYEEALRISPGDPVVTGNLRVLERMSTIR